MESSRSHAILTAKIYQRNLSTSELIVSTLHLVDLAGSEKVKKTGAVGTRLIEASNINKSLLCLSKVRIFFIVFNIKHLTVTDFFLFFIF